MACRVSITGPGETIEQVSDPDLGIPAWVMFGHESLVHGSGLEPELVCHAILSIAWLVTEVLDGWQRPGARRRHGDSAVIKWWLLKVPGRCRAARSNAASS